MEHEPHSTHLANGHSQIAGEVHDYAAILVTTGRALDFQHQGSFSIPESQKGTFYFTYVSSQPDSRHAVRRYALTDKNSSNTRS